MWGLFVKLSGTIGYIEKVTLLSAGTMAWRACGLNFKSQVGNNLYEKTSSVANFLVLDLCRDSFANFNRRLNHTPAQTRRCTNVFMSKKLKRAHS